MSFHHTLSRGRWLALVGALALVAAVPGAAVAQDESPAAAESAAPEAAAPVNPYFETGAELGSGEGKKIG
jgi:hypothetical protein